jgi:hypothetical protein
MNSAVFSNDLNAVNVEETGSAVEIATLEICI